MTEPLDDFPVPDVGAESRSQSLRSKHADAARRTKSFFWMSVAVFLLTFLVYGICVWFPPAPGRGDMMGYVYGNFVLLTGVLGVGASAILALIASFHHRGAMVLL